MKRIIAVIREEMFENVKVALLSAGCEGMNVSTVKGRGRQAGIKESYRGSSYCIDLIPKTRVELIVNEEDLVNALNSIGVTPVDIISILQALKKAGSLQADLQII